MPLAQFRDWLQGQERVRLTLDLLLVGFAQQYPECTGGERREQLWHALARLKEEGVIRLPADSRQNWDTVGKPQLPRFITLVREKAERRDFTEVKWVPELNLAPEIRQTKQLATLSRINEFLIANRGRLDAHVPYRERALQIFGDEKHLEGAVTGGLLYGWLPLSVIAATNPEPPLPREDFPVEGKPLLLVENHHTYWSLLQWNAKVLEYTSIAYGSGNTIMKSASAVATAVERSGAAFAEYFGDLDPAGLAIPEALNIGLAKLGKPLVQPATVLFELLLTRGRPRPLTEGKRKSVSKSALDWLPLAMKIRVTRLFDSGMWLPQEGVGLDLLLESMRPD
jgi:hypothetical protein